MSIKQRDGRLGRAFGAASLPASRPRVLREEPPAFNASIKKQIRILWMKFVSRHGLFCFSERTDRTRAGKSCGQHTGTCATIPKSPRAAGRIKGNPWSLNPTTFFSYAFESNALC